MRVQSAEDVRVLLREEAHLTPTRLLGLRVDGILNPAHDAREDVGGEEHDALRDVGGDAPNEVPEGAALREVHPVLSLEGEHALVHRALDHLQRTQQSQHEVVSDGQSSGVSSWSFSF